MAQFRRTAGLAAAAALACSAPPVRQIAPPSIDLETARAAITAANQSLSTGYRRKDFAAMAGLYAEDGATFPADKPAVRGRAAIEADLRTSAGSAPAIAVTNDTDELFAAGESVVEIGTWTERPAAAMDSAATYRGRYFVLWKRDSTGTWKIFREMFNAHALKQ